MTWKDDLSNSARDFIETVSPKIEQWVEGEMVAVEGSTETRTAEKLDQIAGVDYWNFETDVGVRPVGSRVQYGKNGTNRDGEPFDTFTIRHARSSGVPTEFEKRLRAIREDMLYPYWTVQAYLTEPRGDLMSVAMTKTKPLIKYLDRIDVEKEPGVWQNRAWDTDGSWADFYCASWNFLRFDTEIGVQTHHDQDVINRYKRQAVGQTTLPDGGKGGDD